MRHWLGSGRLLRRNGTDHQEEKKKAEQTGGDRAKPATKTGKTHAKHPSPAPAISGSPVLGATGRETLGAYKFYVPSPSGSKLLRPCFQQPRRAILPREGHSKHLKGPYGGGSGELGISDWPACVARPGARQATAPVRATSISRVIARSPDTHTPATKRTEHHTILAEISLAGQSAYSKFT